VNGQQGPTLESSWPNPHRKRRCRIIFLAPGGGAVPGICTPLHSQRICAAEAIQGIEGLLIDCACNVQHTRYYGPINLNYRGRLIAAFQMAARQFTGTIWRAAREEGGTGVCAVLLCGHGEGGRMQLRRRQAAANGIGDSRQRTKLLASCFMDRPCTHTQSRAGALIRPDRNFAVLLQVLRSTPYTPWHPGLVGPASRLYKSGSSRWLLNTGAYRTIFACCASM
jgi:hypothetical protein